MDRLRERFLGARQRANRLAASIRYLIGYGPYSDYHFGFVIRYLELLEANDQEFDAWSSWKRNRVAWYVFRNFGFGRSVANYGSDQDFETGLHHASLIYGAKLYENDNTSDPFLYCVQTKETVHGSVLAHYFWLAKRMKVIQREMNLLGGRRKQGFARAMMEYTELHRP
jgi:hypothetical protein